MKRIQITIFFLSFLAFTMSASAQTPKDGILIKLENYELDLSKGSAETTVYLVRSKRLSKVKLDPVKVQKYEGLDIILEPITDKADAYKMTVTATDSFTGAATLIVDGAGRWGSKMKSTSFTVNGVSGTQISRN